MNETTTQRPVHRRPSVAMITRAHWPEAPFLDEFIAHYLRLGVDAVYLINTEPDPARRGFLDALDPALRGAIREVVPPVLEPEEEVLAAGLDAVEEDWVLMVDVDEFLWLEGRTIREVLRPRWNLYRFTWTLTPFTGNELPSALSALGRTPFTRGNALKSLARRRDVNGVVTPHEFAMEDPRKVTIRDCLAHVIARGFYDTVNKLAEQRIDKHDTGYIARFLRGEATGFHELPLRVVLTLVARAMPPVAPLFIPPAGRGTNLDLLHEITRASCARFGVDMATLDGDRLLAPFRHEPEQSRSPLRRIALGWMCEGHPLARRLLGELRAAALQFVDELGLDREPVLDVLLGPVGGDLDQGFKSAAARVIARQMKWRSARAARLLLDRAPGVEALFHVELLQSGEMHFTPRADQVAVASPPSGP